MQEQYSQEGIDAITKRGNAIPGQSLTSNPDEPRPFESAPEFVNKRYLYVYYGCSRRWSSYS